MMRRFLAAILAATIGFALSYNFGPDVGITFVCFLVSWFGGLNKAHTQHWS